MGDFFLYLLFGCVVRCEPLPEKTPAQVMQERTIASEGETKARFWLRIAVKDLRSGVQSGTALAMVHEGLKDAGLTIADIATDEEFMIILGSEKTQFVHQ